MVNSRLIVFMLVLSPTPVRASDTPTLLLPFPGSQLVGQTADDNFDTHQLITGSVERVNTVYQPEASEYVKGRKHTQTFQIFNERGTGAVGQFFRDQLLKQGQILFECEGRSCGSSTYWANTLFKRYLLYGPEQYQKYYVAKLTSNGTHFVTVYVAQRGTGKLYAHIETVTLDQDESFDEETVNAAIEAQGKYVFDTKVDDQVLNTIYKSINTSDITQFALVGHDDLQGDETVEAAIDRTRELAEKVKSKLINKGVATTRLLAFGAGPLAPMAKQHKRIELVPLKR